MSTMRDCGRYGLVEQFSDGGYRFVDKPLIVKPVAALLLIAALGCGHAGRRCAEVVQWQLPSLGVDWHTVGAVDTANATNHLVHMRRVRVCSDGSTEVVKEWTEVQRW